LRWICTVAENRKTGKEQQENQFQSEEEEQKQIKGQEKRLNAKTVVGILKENNPIGLFISRCSHALCLLCVLDVMWGDDVG
jgi:hypothetical protein